MAKFFKFALAPTVDSGTTDGSPSGSNDLIQSGQNFLTTVSVGDYVHNTTDDAWHVVSAVNSDTQLNLESGTVATGKAYTIYSGNIANYNYQLVSAENVVIVEQASQSTTTIAYSAGSTSADVITVTHGKLAASTSTDVRDNVQDALLALHGGKTRPDAYKLVEMPTDIIVTGIAVA